MTLRLDASGVQYYCGKCDKLVYPPERYYRSESYPTPTGAMKMRVAVCKKHADKERGK